jgi:hypothetical protein
MLFINILILFFLLLIIYQIFLALFGNVIEGMEGDYKEYDTNDPNNALILSQQNAGNIAYLKQRIDELMDLKTTVVDICGNVVQLNQQVQALVQQQADAAQQLSGDEPVTVSGLDTSTTT